jgi:membrane-associated protease RseP (regulator of RpoE activity)
MSTANVLQNPHVDELTWTRAPAPSSPWLQILLLLTTLLTTTAVGARYMYNFELGNAPLTSFTDLFPFAWVWDNPDRIGSGLPFSLTLLAILLTHELGHYIACRAFGVRTSLPFVFPAPTLSGTAGALIRMKSRIPSRTALIVIGASGPIAGFCVALPATCYGLLHSTVAVGQTPPSIIRFESPMLINLLHRFLSGSHPDLPLLSQMVPHPVLVASWIGILVTSLNLIPAGQLDGGHIVYALSPRAHKLCTQITIAALLYLGTVEWIGWLPWAFLLMLPMMTHPALPATESGPSEADPAVNAAYLLLAALCLGIFLLCGTFQPCVGNSLMNVLLRIHWGLSF